MKKIKEKKWKMSNIKENSQINSLEFKTIPIEGTPHQKLEEKKQNNEGNSGRKC